MYTKDSLRSFVGKLFTYTYPEYTMGASVLHETKHYQCSNSDFEILASTRRARIYHSDSIDTAQEGAPMHTMNKC